MRNLIGLISFILVSVSASFGVTEYYAFLVGIEDYPGEAYDRDYAINDISDVKNALIQVGDWSEEQPQHIWELKNNEAYKSLILGHLYYLADEVVDYDDVLLFMFSGRGDNSPRGLVPYDTNNRITAFDLMDVLEYFAENSTQKIIIILDADYSGWFQSQDFGAILMACGEDQEILISENWQNGVFSYFIAEGIMGFADLSGSRISAEDVFEYAEDKMELLEQIPDIDDNFPFWYNPSGDLEFLVKSFTKSGSFSHDETWSGPTIYLSGDVTVPAERTLTILSPTTVNVNGYDLGCTGDGKIDKGSTATVTGYKHYAKQGSYYKGFYQSSTSIQQIINWASSGWDIHVGSGTHSGNVNMKSGVDVIGGSKWSTHINGSVYYSSDNNTILQDLSVTGLIHINYGSGNEINRVESNKTSGTTLDLYNSVIELWQYDNTEGVNYAVYSHNSSNIDISYCTIYDANRAIYTSGSSADIWGMAFCGNTYDIYRTGGGTIWIEDDNMLFSDYPEDCTYGVEEELPETYDICGVYKRITTTSAPAGNSAQDPQLAVSLQNNEGVDEYSAGASIIRGIKSEIREKKESGIETNRQDYASDYVRAIGLFKQVIDRYPDSHWSINALSRIQASYRELGEFEQLSEYADSLLDDPKYLALRPHVLNSLIPYYIHSSDYQKALQLSDEILANSPDDQLDCEILYGEGVINRFFLDNQAKASEIFKKVISSYPDHPTSLSARRQLEDMDVEYTEEDSSSAQTDRQLVIQSYPNPFNPSNTIRFALPEEGQVILKVYDVLGREVATLVNELRPAGSHVVTFDGSRLVSGVYIYRLEAGGEVLSGKMILLK